MEYYKAVDENEAGQGWLICWTGTDRDGHGYNVETVGVHGSDLGLYTGGAKKDAEDIAEFLNKRMDKWYDESETLRALEGINELMRMCQVGDLDQHFLPALIIAKNEMA